MPNCCVKNCPNRTGTIGGGKYTYFRFPKEPQLRKVWMEACGRNEETFKADHGRVCQQHFESVCFKNYNSLQMPGNKRLVAGSVPTKCLMLARKSSEKSGERTPLFAYKELVSSLRRNSEV